MFRLLCRVRIVCIWLGTFYVVFPQIGTPLPIHPLLSCSQSKDWREFHDLVSRATPADGPPCSAPDHDEGRILGAKVFALAARLADGFAHQHQRVVAQPSAHFMFCGAGTEPHVDYMDWLREVTFEMWEISLASLMHEASGRTLAPCMFGWLTAVVCTLQVSRDRDQGRWPDLMTRAREDLIAGIAASEEFAPFQQAALEGLETGASFELQHQVSSLWDALTTRGVLVLLTSSSWPLRLEHLVQFLPSPVIGNALSPRDLSEAHRLARQQLEMFDVAFVPDDHREFSVWALSIHASSMLEPRTVLSGMAGLHDFRVLAVDGCHGQDLGIWCYMSGHLREALAQGIQNLHSAVPELRTSSPVVTDLSLLRARFIDLAPLEADIAAADILFCGNVAFICGLLLALNTRPVVGYIGDMLGAYLSDGDRRDLLGVIIDAMSGAAGPALTLVMASPQLAAQARLQAGAEFAVASPVGLYTGVAAGAFFGGSDATEDVLVTRQALRFWDHTTILNFFIEGFGLSWRFVEVGAASAMGWQAWSRYRAAVVLPREPLQASFYELYGMAMPLLVPAEHLLPLFFAGSAFNIREVAGMHRRVDALSMGKWRKYPMPSFQDLVWWAALSDAAQMPHLLQWSSIVELVAMLLPKGTDVLLSASYEMRRHTELLFASAVHVWYGALAVLLAKDSP